MKPLALTTRNGIRTILFVLAIVLGGTFHLLGYFPTADQYWGTLCFALTLTIYGTLVIIWIHSVDIRLLPSRGRVYIMVSAVLMLFFLLLREVKYRIIPDENIPLTLAVWYLYYLPLLFIPTLFMMMCVYSHLRLKTRTRHFNELLLLIFPALLFVLVSTNSLHHWVFIPNPGTILTGQGNDYTYGFGMWLIWGWTLFAASCGIMLLLVISRRTNDFRKIFFPFSGIVLYACMVEANRLFGLYGLYRPYMLPETAVFCFLAVYEACIRTRLIPYNENYEGFFSRFGIPTLITDRLYTPIYRTSTRDALPTKEQLRAACSAPIYIDPDNMLSCRPLSRGEGYVFYLQDQSDLHSMDRRLTEINAELDRENAFIQAENELKEQKAHIEARNRIYAHIATVMYPKQQQIAALLHDATPGDPSFAYTAALALVQNVYIKRGTNMLLAQQEPFTMRDLYLAFAESARFFEYCGLRIVISGTPDGDIDARMAFDLYTAFHCICEVLLPSTTTVILYMTDGVLRLLPDAAELPPMSGIRLPLTTFVEDGQWYILVKAGGEGSDV